MSLPDLIRQSMRWLNMDHRVKPGGDGKGSYAVVLGLVPGIRVPKKFKDSGYWCRILRPLFVSPPPKKTGDYRELRNPFAFTLSHLTSNEREEV
jgi:hypothetical protein